MRTQSRVTLVIFSLIALIVSSVQCHFDAPENQQLLRRSRQETKVSPCGTEAASEEDKAARDKALSFQKFKSRKTGDNFRLGTEKVIKVCFHVPSNPFKRLFMVQHVTDREIQNQLDHLNKAFSSGSCCDTSLSWCNGECSTNTNIRFVLAKKDFFNRLTEGTTENAKDHGACIIRKFSFLWTFLSRGSNKERRIFKKFRRGDASVLNVFLIKPQPPLVPFLSGQGYLLGYASFPWNYAANPDMDGVVVRPTTVTGGTFPTKGEGDTLVHEIGHWLGLYHTFDSGCFPGDYIDDTPAQDSAGFDCPIGQDTCFESGEDPIHNFLDYTSDACQYQFTEGQVAVMHANIEAYRSGDPINLPPVILTSGVASDPYSLATGRLRSFELPNVPENSTVFCSASATDGNLELLLNWDGSLTRFDCEAESGKTAEICFASTMEPGTLYAMVFASFSTTDFRVKCTILSMEEAPVALSDGVASADIDLMAGDIQPFTFDASPSTDIKSVECIVRADSGDFVLVTGWDENIGLLECVSLTGSACGLFSSYSNTSFAWVYALTNSTGVSMTCTKDVTEAIELLDGVPSSVFSFNETWQQRLFVISVTEPAGRVSCSTTADNGDIDLDVSWEGDNSVYDCSSNDQGSMEECTAGPSNSEIAFVRIKAFEITTNVVVTCDIQGAIELTDGAASAKYDVSEDELEIFSIEVPGVSTVRCSTSVHPRLFSSEGDIDLYLNWDGEVGTYLCRSESGDSSESCVVGPGSGTVYAFVYGYVDTNDFQITCTLLDSD